MFFCTLTLAEDVFTTSLGYYKNGAQIMKVYLEVKISPPDLMSMECNIRRECVVFFDSLDNKS